MELVISPTRAGSLLCLVFVTSLCLSSRCVAPWFVRGTTCPWQNVHWFLWTAVQSLGRNDLVVIGFCQKPSASFLIPKRRLIPLTLQSPRALHLDSFINILLRSMASTHILCQAHESFPYLTSAYHILNFYWIFPSQSYHHLIFLYQLNPAYCPEIITFFSSLVLWAWDPANVCRSPEQMLQNLNKWVLQNFVDKTYSQFCFSISWCPQPWILGS